MAENPQAQNQNQPNTPTPDITKIIDSMPDYHQEGIIEKKFDKLPLVFVERHSLVKIAITKNYVNCSWRFDNFSKNILDEGCFLYDNGEIKPVSGIYYAPKIGFPMKYFTGPNILVKDAKQKIRSFAELAKAQFNRSFDPNKWLIRYYNHQIRIYNYANLIKGETIKFPLIKKVYELKVVKLPRIESPLEYKVVREVQVGDYKILFSNDVIKFKIYSFGGWAELIYIYNNDATTEVEVKYNPFGEEVHEKFDVHRGNLLLFAQGREQKAETRILIRNIK
jgi:hypothetical protein